MCAERVVQHGDAERKNGRGTEAVDGLCDDEDAEVARYRRSSSVFRLDRRTPGRVVPVDPTHAVDLRRRIGQVHGCREVRHAEEDTAAGETEKADPNGPGPVDSAGRMDLTRFNNIAIQGKTPRWQVDKEAIGLSRVKQVLLYV